MWPRASEALVGLWLVVAPLLWASGGAELGQLSVSMIGGTVALFLVARAWTRRGPHFAMLGLALVLIAWGWGAFPRPGPRLAQNGILCGLMLGLLSVVPNDPWQPPHGWRPHVGDPDGHAAEGDDPNH